MKKFAKFLFGTLSLAALIGGTYYFIKNVINKDTADDFDDFEDDFDIPDDEEDDDLTDSREYVTLNISPEDVASPLDGASDETAAAPPLEDVKEEPVEEIIRETKEEV